MNHEEENKKIKKRVTFLDSEYAINGIRYRGDRTDYPRASENECASTEELLSRPEVKDVYLYHGRPKKRRQIEKAPPQIATPSEEIVEHTPTLDSERGTSKKLNSQYTSSKEELASPVIAAPQIESTSTKLNSPYSENFFFNTVADSATKGAAIGAVVGGVIGFFAGGVGAIPGIAIGALIGAAASALITTVTHAICFSCALKKKKNQRDITIEQVYNSEEKSLVATLYSKNLNTKKDHDELLIDPTDSTSPA